MTQYRTEVSKDVNSLNILAIPQDIGASVTIAGKENLKEGDNIVTINVISQDNITQKKYVVNVHRRSEQEEIQNAEEQEHGAERLSAIIEEKQLEQNETRNNYENQDGKLNIKTPIIITIIVIIVGTTSAVIIYRNRRSK